MGRNDRELGASAGIGGVLVAAVVAALATAGGLAAVDAHDGANDVDLLNVFVNVTEYERQTYAD